MREKHVTTFLNHDTRCRAFVSHLLPTTGWELNGFQSLSLIQLLFLLGSFVVGTKRESALKASTCLQLCRIEMCAKHRGEVTDSDSCGQLLRRRVAQFECKENYEHSQNKQVINQNKKTAYRSFLGAWQATSSPSGRARL